jgi:uncharacterized SAM-binding protein YcdF (DUF218 family)
MMVDGGFFWTGGGHPVVTLADGDRVTNCVFYARPQWYQLMRWYRAWRYWLALPTHAADGPKEQP